MSKLIYKTWSKRMEWRIDLQDGDVDLSEKGVEEAEKSGSC